MRHTIEIGQVFGRLTVEADSGQRDRHGSIMWRCACSCGSSALVRGYGLRRGATPSCGCRRKDIVHPAARSLTVDGLTMTVSQWSESSGIAYDTILRRLNRSGWSESRAVTEPALQHTNRTATVGGRTMSWKKWSKETGIAYDSIVSRVLRCGWSPERAVTQPIQGTREAGELKA